MRDPLPATVQARLVRERPALALAAAFLLALAGCHSLDRPSYLAFRAGKLLGVDLARGGAIPVDALIESGNRQRAGVPGAIVAYTSIRDTDYLRVWFAASAEAESAELFFSNEAKRPRPVVAALWTPRFSERKGWRAEAEQLGVKVGQIQGFSPDFGTIFATQEPRLYVLLGADGRSPQGRISGLLRTSDLAGFLAKRGALLSLSAVRDRVEQALKQGELQTALRDRPLLDSVVTGEASALLTRLDAGSTAASGARAASGLASLGTAEAPPVAQELVALARASAGAGAELVVARANAVVGLAQRWAASSGRGKRILGRAPSAGLRVKFSLYKEARELGRVKLGPQADAATARFVAALHRELVELTGHAASRAEVALRPATAAAMRLLVAGLRAPEGASGPEPAALQAVQALLGPLFAKLVPAPDPAATTIELVRPAYEADLAADWPYFTRAGAAPPTLADHAARGRAAGNPPLEVVVDSASLDVSQVSFTTRDTYATTPPLMGTEKNPAHWEWSVAMQRLNRRSAALKEAKEQKEASDRIPMKGGTVTVVNPNSWIDRQLSAQSAQRNANARDSLTAEEAYLKAAYERLDEPPRELPVELRPGWRYQVHHQRWVGTATRLVKVRGARGEEVLRQTFDLGEVASLEFRRNAQDYSHNGQWLQGRNDWKELAYIKAQLPTLMDGALAAWLRPAFAELLARKRLAAIDAHTTDAAERGWLKFFFGASTADERAQLDPAEPGADPVFTGTPVALAVGAKWRPRERMAMADEERLLPMPRAPEQLHWHAGGERFVLTRDGAVEVRSANGELLATRSPAQPANRLEQFTPGGAPVEDPSCSFGVLGDNTGFLCRRSGRVARLRRFAPVTSARLRLNGWAAVADRARRRGEPVVSRDGLAVLTTTGSLSDTFHAEGSLRVHIERVDGEVPVALGTGELPLATDFQFTPDGRHVLGADTSVDGRVSVWDGVTGALVRDYAAPRAGLRPSAVALSPDGTTLVIGYYVPESQSGLLRVLRRASAR